MKQKLIQKKRKQEKKINLNPKLLSTSFSFLSSEETLMTEKEIREHLRVLFKYHIGQENAISRYNLFLEILNINPYKMDIYKRTYWWKVIDRAIKNIREDCFIIRKGSNYFVLKSEDELKYYKKITNTILDNVRRSQTVATDWVVKKRWRYL